MKSVTEYPKWEMTKKDKKKCLAAKLTQRTAQTSSVTLIQSLGSALNLNVHFHMLFLDGIYTKKLGLIQFEHTIAPNHQKLAILVHSISPRAARYLERLGILERDEEKQLPTAGWH